MAACEGAGELVTVFFPGGGVKPVDAPVVVSLAALLDAPADSAVPVTEDNGLGTPSTGSLPYTESFVSLWFSTVRLSTGGVFADVAVLLVLAAPAVDTSGTTGATGFEASPSPSPRFSSGCGNALPESSFSGAGKSLTVGGLNVPGVLGAAGALAVVAGPVAPDEPLDVPVALDAAVAGVSDELLDADDLPGSVEPLDADEAVDSFFDSFDSIGDDGAL